jgi:hypothetical protein
MIDREAADLREGVAELSDEGRVLFLIYARLAVDMLTDLLSHDDPALSMRAYRDQLHQYLSTQGEI